MCRAHGPVLVQRRRVYPTPPPLPRWWLGGFGRRQSVRSAKSVGTGTIGAFVIPFDHLPEVAPAMIAPSDRMNAALREMRHHGGVGHCRIGGRAAAVSQDHDGGESELTRMHGVSLRGKRRSRADVPGDIAIALPVLPQPGARMVLGRRDAWPALSEAICGGKIWSRPAKNPGYVSGVGSLAMRRRPIM